MNKSIGTARSLRRLWTGCVRCIALLSLGVSSVLAQDAQTQTQTAHRPRVGLVLSGGGARGVAHVGVLKVLEELHIPIDVVVGTSMGAVVGGLYASGMSAEDIEKLTRSVNWQDAFQDRPPRADLGFRRKQDDQNFLVRYAMGVSHDGFILPKGFIQGQKLNQVLRTSTLPVAEIDDFDRLPIPFRAISTDLETGQAVVMSKGDLATAMRASMSAPGVFQPVQLDGHLLVDGGLVNNLPIDVARSMNVDIVIAVDVSFPLYKKSELTSPIEITNQAFAILIRNRTLAQREQLQPTDVFMEPDLGNLTSSDFTRVEQSIDAGRSAALKTRERLASLTVDDATYRAYLAQRRLETNHTPVVNFIRLDPQSHRYERMVDAVMDEVIGKPLDRIQLQKKISSLYALDLFESIDYGLVDSDGSSGLEFHLRRKSWGPNYVRVGLNIEDDFAGNSRYNAAARFIMTELNSLGGEWLTDLQIGDNPKISTEFYQPLSFAPRYFISPKFDFQIRNVQVRDALLGTAEYRVRTIEGGLDVGREFGSWGELRVGVQRGHGTSHVRVGDPHLPEERFERGGFFARFAYDKLDNAYFPRHGEQFGIAWTAERAGMGADHNLNSIQANWLVARSIDRHTFIFSTAAGTTLDNVSSPQDFFQLGGFLNLSGLTSNSISGPHYGIGRLIYYRKIGKGGSGVLDFPAYAGVSFEAGNVWKDRGDAAWGSMKKDMSVFLGLDTLLGPVYLGTGLDSSGQKAFYLFLGRTF